MTDSTPNPMQRADELLRRMTLDEKTLQLSSIMPFSLLGVDGVKTAQLERLLSNGIGHLSGGVAGYKHPSQAAAISNQIQAYLVNHTRLGIPAIAHVEALNGVVAPHYTSFPTAIALAATWDGELVQKMADLIRRQMRATGLHQALAPVMDVARDARWGRVHETYGEDPYLASALSVAYVRGLQGEDLSAGALATAKHFLGYAFTEGGQNMAASPITERELYEVYARPFEAAVKLAGLGSVMNSYSTIDGVPVASSVGVLDTLLRHRLGFEGTVVADYSAIKALYVRQFVARDAQEAGVLAITAGLDIELPTVDSYGPTLADAVRKGLVDESVVDRSVRRILRDKYALGLFDNPYVPEDPIVIDELAHAGGELALELARESITVLKNQNDLLPIPRTLERIAIVGPHARGVDFAFAPYTFPASLAMIRHLAGGGGANMAGIEGIEDYLPDMEMMGLELGPIFAKTPDQFARDDYGAESLVDAITRAAPGTEIVVAEGTGLLDSEGHELDAAVEAARGADLVILALGGRGGWFSGGNTEGEGADSADIGLPAPQVELVKAIAATGTPSVGLVFSGRPLTLTEVVDDLDAIVFGYYGGQAGARAVVDVLTGEVNPSGKLPYSVPRHSGQIPIHHGQHNGSGYRRSEGDIHRGYLDMPPTPLFPFGHGLSYTTFGYSDLSLSSPVVPSDGEIAVSMIVANEGPRAGVETVQLYFADRASGVTRPAQELVGFTRVSLEAGEARSVEFAVKMSQLGYLGVDGRFILEPGSISVTVGSSSADIRLTGEFEVVGDTVDLTGERTYLSASTVRER